ncbi:unnamed protein product [Urochloa humidicola]
MTDGPMPCAGPDVSCQASAAGEPIGAGEATRDVLRFPRGSQRHIVEQWPPVGSPPPPYARARRSLTMPAPPPGRVMAAPATGSNLHQDKCLPPLLFIYGPQTLATTLVPTALHKPSRKDPGGRWGLGHGVRNLLVAVVGKSEDCRLS